MPTTTRFPNSGQISFSNVGSYTINGWDSNNTQVSLETQSTSGVNPANLDQHKPDKATTHRISEFYS